MSRWSTRRSARKARKSLFGFAMPNLPFFSGDSSADEVSETLDIDHQPGQRDRYGKFRITIAEGKMPFGKPRSLRTMRDPRPGD
jgi:hypothetical protein